MATTVQLAGEPRDKTGTAEARRLRKRGRVPGNIYGHGEGSVTISVAEEEITPMIFAGHRLLDVQVNGNSELAILRDVQWDTFGQKILHFDLVRVSRDEKVEMEVAVELRGIAPGVTAGGVMDQHLRGILVKCAAFSIPESIVVTTNELEIGDSIHVRDLEVPDGVEILHGPEELVLQIIEPIEVPEEEEEAAEVGPAEPEVIGREEESEDEPEQD